ncbi:CaiB/BaiF CoA transferase family protein [Marinobacter litoralis]|uniref:CaiB/BaiF CoA transferase family protein n=1 Tax=Marinobacter litoralis TaxID=187981 RepID=UPI0018ECFC77|nr:CaiB/BaiF CoA-transferase family protein [Marinobacter litoralis]MBJ6136096.1 CoA transferase [Marinobacter litoralis]
MNAPSLEGLLVVSLEQAVAAPYCTSRLADAGARVIKVERGEGDFARYYDQAAAGESSYFVWLNRGKESICLDIKDSEDQRLLLQMLKEADVFVQNLAPGAAERAGFGSAALRAANPRLITVDITGYGGHGPYQNMKGYDLLVQCESGLASITGAADEPARVGVSVCDIACGMYAHAEVLRALIGRERTGQGESIEVSLFDSIADWMTVPLLQCESQQVPMERVGLRHPAITPYEVYTCADQQQVVLAIQNQREWERFCDQVLAFPGLKTDPRYQSNIARCIHRDTLNEVVRPIIATMSRQALVDRLSEARIAYGEVKTVEQLSQHPQLRRTQVETASGPVSVVAPPAISRRSSHRLGPVPALGEQSAQLRREFGARKSDVMETQP